MAGIAIEKQRAMSAGDQLKGNAFTGAVRSLENPGLELNDTWTFPTQYEVYTTKVGGVDVEYIWIELENGKAKKFFPSTFTKQREVYNEAVAGGLPTPTGVRKFTQGTAAEEFRSHGNVAEAMAALAGKKVKVTNMETIRTLRFNTNSLQNTLIPTIEFVN